MQAIALAAIFAGTMLPLALIAIRESTGRRKGEVAAAAEGARATALATQLADMTTHYKEEKARREKLSKVHSQLLAKMATANAAGSYGELLQILAAAEDGDGNGVLYQPGAAKPNADTDLLDPFDDGGASAGLSGAGGAGA